ncbi:MAG: peptidylprolyl isomerase [Rhodobacter sp.]
MKLMMKAFPSHMTPKGPIDLFGLLMIAVACTAIFTPLSYALAQANPFSTAIIVSDRAINYYGIDQRVLLEKLLGTPGNLGVAAQNNLIDDSLRLAEANRLGITASQEAIDRALADFANRANKSTSEVLKYLASQGIDAQTLINFLTANIVWRDVVRKKFVGRTEISPTDVDRALLAQTRGQRTRVFLSELIMPLTPQNRDQTVDFAASLRELNLNQEQFSELAQKYSAAQTASNGGKLDWLPLSKLPILIADEVKTLAKDEVTAPIFLTNAVAVFQMRGIDEKGAPEPISVFVDYALIGTKDTAVLAQMEGSVDTCDDLYEFSKNDPTILINRNSQARSSLAPDVALAISKIDLGEVGPLSGGTEAQAVMLCNLSAQREVAPDRDQLKEMLLNRRLAVLSQSYLSELRSNAIIRQP